MFGRILVSFESGALVDRVAAIQHRLTVTNTQTTVSHAIRDKNQDIQRCSIDLRTDARVSRGFYLCLLLPDAVSDDFARFVGIERQQA